MQVYVNRAKKISDSSFVYWTTEDSSDSGMGASNAPSPISDYTDVVTIGMRSVRSFLKMQDLSSQCDGSNQTFTGSSLEIEETSTTTFTTDFTAPTDSVMVAGYRPR